MPRIRQPDISDYSLSCTYRVQPNISLTQYSDAITISCNGVGCGSTYYHDYPFSITGDAIILREKRDISKLVKQYIAGVYDTFFNAHYSYEEKCNAKKAQNELIPLPAITSTPPNWDYVARLGGVDMSKIDTSEWKEYKLLDIGFEIYHGKRLTKADRIPGVIPLLTAGEENQGVAEYIGNDCQIYKNPITVDMFGNCFYHDGICAGDDNVYFFVNDSIPREAKIYLASCISTKTSGIYSYNEQFRQGDANELAVLLPVKETYEPDWEYMENHIKTLATRVGDTLSRLESARVVPGKKIDAKSWKKFTVGDLFSIHPTKAYKMTNAELMNGGSVPVIVNSSYKNGIGGYTTYAPTESGGIITFSDTVDASTIFYQKDAFVGYPHVQGVYPINEAGWSEYSLLFFCSVFRKTALAKGFDYGNKFKRDIAGKMEVLLPVKEDGEIDFLWMEERERESEDLYGESGLSAQYCEERGLIWTKFLCGELFECKNTGNILSRDVEYGSGETPFVTATAFNNGVTGYIDASRYEIIQGNCILVGGKTFTITFQPDDFVSNDSHNFVIRSENYELCNLAYFYLVAEINSHFSKKYTWDDAVTKDKFLHEQISLPCLLDDSPNWNFMEQYMKTIEKTTKTKLDALSADNIREGDAYD